MESKSKTEDHLEHRWWQFLATLSTTVKIQTLYWLEYPFWGHLITLKHLEKMKRDACYSSTEIDFQCIITGIDSLYRSHLIIYRAHGVVTPSYMVWLLLPFQHRKLSSCNSLCSQWRSCILTGCFRLQLSTWTIKPDFLSVQQLHPAFCLFAVHLLLTVSYYKVMYLQT